jgi:hypothetical protein
MQFRAAPAASRLRNDAARRLHAILYEIISGGVG